MQFPGGKMKLRTRCSKQHLRGKPLRLLPHVSLTNSCSEDVLNRCLILNYAYFLLAFKVPTIQVCKSHASYESTRVWLPEYFDLIHVRLFVPKESKFTALKKSCMAGRNIGNTCTYKKLLYNTTGTKTPGEQKAVTTPREFT